MPYDPTSDADIQAATMMARKTVDAPVGPTPQELEFAHQYAQEQHEKNRTWQDFAGDVGHALYGMKDIGLFHDIIPGAIESAKQGFTAPGRAYQSGSSGHPWSEEQMINEAMNLAGMTTLGAGAIPAEANALRAGISLPTKRFSMQEASQIHGLPTEELKKGLSKITRPQEKWNYAYQEPVNTVVQKEFDPNILKPGDVFVPLFGDRTMSGRTLTEIGGNPLSEPVVAEGGPTYMLNPHNQIWASGQSVISGIANKAENALRASEKLGHKDPAAYGVYVPMGKASGDFSTHTADAIVSMLPSAPITVKAAKAFDEAMRNELPDFPGVKSEQLRAYLMEPGAGAKRIIFSKMMDKKPWRQAGFPDVGEARFATTNPDLLSAPDYAGGYTIGRINRENPVIKNPEMGHRSYPVALGGEYVGGLPINLHKDIIFPNWTSYYDRVMNPEKANYGPAKYKSYANMMAYQPFGPRTIADLQERILKASNRAHGGGVDESADIHAALHLARPRMADGGAPDDFRAPSVQPATNILPQEAEAAKQYAQEQHDANRTWPQYAQEMGNALYGMKDVGLFHDIIPGAIESVKQGFTAPGRAYQAGAEGRPWNDDQMIAEALNTAGMTTLGAGAVPAEANALRAGAGMYSKAERAALGLPMEKMQGPQALAMLGKAGIGPEELKWTGLADRLPQEQALTKQQLVDMIRQNDVQLGETVLGKVNREYTPQAQRHDELLLKELNDGLTSEEANELKSLATAISAQEFQKPKFKSYSLPGGENYQETLITLPKPANAEDPYNFKAGHWENPNVLAHIRTNEFNTPEGKVFNLDELQSDWAQKGRSSGFVAKNNINKLPEGTIIHPPGNQYADIYALELPQSFSGRNLFYGTTEDEAQANALAFINGPRPGVVPSAPYVQSTNQWTDLGIKKAMTKAMDSGADIFTWTPGDVQSKRFSLGNQISELNATPTKDGMIRLSAYAPDGETAVINGEFYTPEELPNVVGKEMAEKIMSKIEFGEEKPPMKFVVSNRLSGNVSEPFASEEAAKAAISQYPESLQQDLQVILDPPKYKIPRTARFSGLDLNVGGEGMKEFYGNIVPKRISEVIRKSTKQKPEFGTFPVETAEGTVNLPGIKLTPEIKAALQATKETEGGYFSHFNMGGKVDGNVVNKALRIAAEAST